MERVGTFFALLAVAPYAIAIPTAAAPAASPTATSTEHLHTAAKAAGKLYFGTATDNPELTDTAYTTILDDNTMFGQITPGNSMKWDATEPEQGTFTFTAGDVVANLAKTNGQLLRGHNTVWYNQLPSWVSDSGFTASELESVVTTHVSTVVSHYAGQISVGSIADFPHMLPEPFNENGTYRTDVFYNTLGESYIPLALQTARQADPNAKLYINEYNIEYAGAKATALLNLVQQLKADNVPIDGIGMQGHFILGQIPSDLQSIIEQFTALGVEVAITELDIRITLPATDEDLEQQRSDYQSVVSACEAVSDCIGVTVWDFTDKYSWVPSTFSGQGDACPWNEDLNRKPAYDGIVAGFQS